MRIINNQINYPSLKNPSDSKNTNRTSNQFDKILNQTITSNQQIKFSKHASMRLSARNIKFSNDQITKLEKGIEKAEKKGIKDSLVFMDQIALVVNIKNRTVVTAIDSNQNEDRVFTNIDGAVII